jgi:hypothetical protein
MSLVRESYSFTDFVTHWAAESARMPADIAALVAQAIVNDELNCDVHNPHAMGPSDRDQRPFSDDPHWQVFEADVRDHLYFVGQGTASPDLAGRLRYVTLSRDDVNRWFASRNQELPQFWRSITVADSDGDTLVNTSASPHGNREYRNLQKVVAVLAYLCAEGKSKLKRGDKINVLQLSDAIQKLLEEDPALAKLLGQGLSPSTLRQKISEALKVFDEDR